MSIRMIWATAIQKAAVEMSSMAVLSAVGRAV
jgi:hypothetical protein